MTEDVACRSCFFWAREPEGRYGECRRDAPVVKAGAGHGYAAWPRTLPLDWCGEHARPVPGEPPRWADGSEAPPRPGPAAATRTGAHR